MTRRLSGVALATAAVVCVLSILGNVPAVYALPLIGMLTAWSAHPDGVPEARVLAASSRNLVIGSLVLAALAVVAFQDRLQRLLIVRFGTDLDSLVITLLSVAVLALPVARLRSRSSSGSCYATRRRAPRLLHRWERRTRERAVAGTPGSQACIGLALGAARPCPRSAGIRSGGTRWLVRRHRRA